MDSNYYTEERLQKNLNQQSKTDDRKTESENFLGNLWLKYIFFFHHLANFLYFHQHKILQHPFFFNQKSPTPLMEQNRRLYREGKSRVDFWGKWMKLDEKRSISISNFKIFHHFRMNTFSLRIQPASKEERGGGEGVERLESIPSSLGRDVGQSPSPQGRTRELQTEQVD